MGEMQGRKLELDVTNIAHGGISVARHDGRVVFVSDAIPGERVLARITEDSKKSFWRAETVSVLTASEHRQAHVWAEAGIDRAPENRAGGADFGHIELGFQRELKRQVLVDSLKRMARVETSAQVEAIAGSDDGTGWRTRVRLHVDESGRLGPFAARSHRVIRVSSLPLAVPEIDAIAPLAESFEGEEHVDIVAPSGGGGARLIVGKQRAQVVTETVGDREFRLSDTGFWQVHRHAAVTLTQAVQDAIDGELFDPKAANLDLYGGVGLLAAAMGDKFGASTHVTSVESDSVATDFASGNLSEWIGANAVTARVETWVRQRVANATASERSQYRAATVVLDPPRSGAGRDVVEKVTELAPAQIVYVACDPVALARDVALFADRGFELTRLRAYDLFPHTHHLEAVATFTRR
ncbi:MAG: class I SAM-dependent RNA methyltransferase [Microbacteriaceae bacterium]